MNWRAWVHNLIVDSAVLPAQDIYGAGSLVDPPQNVPFIITTFIDDAPGPFPGSRMLRAQIWVHDRGGSYVRIDGILDQLRDVFRNAMSEQDFIQATWEGYSQEQTDDSLNTLTRHVSIRLSGKEGGLI